MRVSDVFETSVCCLSYLLNQKNFGLPAPAMSASSVPFQFFVGKSRTSYIQLFQQAHSRLWRAPWKMKYEDCANHFPCFLPDAFAWNHSVNPAAVELVAYPIVEILLVQLFGQLLLADYTRLSGGKMETATPVQQQHLCCMYIHICIYAVHPPIRTAMNSSNHFGNFLPCTLRFWCPKSPRGLGGL